MGVCVCVCAQTHPRTQTHACGLENNAKTDRYVGESVVRQKVSSLREKERERRRAKKEKFHSSIIKDPVRLLI